MTKTTTPLDSTPVLEALGGLDSLALGESFAAADAHASAALSELKARARQDVFPPAIGPVAPAVLAAFDFLEGDADPSAYGDFLADVHALSLDSYPDLSALIRSVAVVRRLQNVARSRAVTAGRPADDVATATLDRFHRTIASHLEGRPEFEPAATMIAVDIPALEARLEAARARHEAHARSEVERLTREKAEADQAVADAERARRADVAAFFATRPSTFNLRGRLYSGAGLASIARGEAARDVVDQYLGTEPLEALERLRLETEAVEAVRRASDSK